MANEVKGRAVLEVGSRDVNGSLRPFIEALEPDSYLGVDIIEGPGVDEICDAEDLVDHYGEEHFDILISTELLEHVHNWQKAISNFKRVLKPGGILFITTRSWGFPYHNHPSDFWRFEISDIRHIFSEFEIRALEKDLEVPGVLLKAIKPITFKEKDLRDYQLYSIVSGKRCDHISKNDIHSLRFRRMVFLAIFRPYLKHLVPENIKRFLRNKIFN